MKLAEVIQVTKVNIILVNVFFCGAGVGYAFFFRDIQVKHILTTFFHVILLLALKCSTSFPPMLSPSPLQPFSSPVVLKTNIQKK
jgi:hypothetical protein